MKKNRNHTNLNYDFPHRHLEHLNAQITSRSQTDLNHLKHLNLSGT